MALRFFKTTVTIVAPLVLGACSANLPSNFSLPLNFPSPAAEKTASAPQPAAKPQATAKPQIGSSARFDNSDKQCLVRAMYFESNRSSESGMLAVATVVMNRVASSQFNNSICAVVGAPNQFAEAILKRPMNEGGPRALANSIAERVLAGERHPGVRNAKFFHQAGLRFPYDNMTYVLEAGGNAFYIKG